MALAYIEENGELVPRSSVVGAIALFTKSPAYAEEVVTNLLKQGFSKTQMVCITKAGKRALESAAKRRSA